MAENTGTALTCRPLSDYGAGWLILHGEESVTSVTRNDATTNEIIQAAGEVMRLVEPVTVTFLIDSLERRDGRTAAINKALAAHRDEPSYDPRGEHDDDPETRLTDFLADALHWCDQYGVDFDAAVEYGRRHYAAETEGGDAFEK